MEKALFNYYDFLYNPKNARNCKECPENGGFSVGMNGDDVLPCGMDSCWVEVLVRAGEKQNDRQPLQIRVVQPNIPGTGAGVQMHPGAVRPV